MSKETKQFVIFGNPVEHSKSPQMQNAGLKHINFDALYKKHQLVDGSTIKDVFLQNSYSGANITVPHKEHAFANADEVRGIAKQIEAVNTYINENGKPDDIYFQTDAPGLGVNLINIYELAHKCKEWANSVLDKYGKHGYVLTSKNLEIFNSKFSNAPIINKAVCYIGLLILVDTYGTSGDLQFKHYTQADSEPKAIFKATQWILDNKD